MPEKLTPEIRAKILTLRKEGKSFIQIEAELKFKKGSLSHISSRSWFKTAMKEKGEDGKTGYHLYQKARLANLKQSRNKRKGDRKEEGKENKKTTEPGGGSITSKEVIDEEVESHLKGSDKDPRTGKKKKESKGGGADQGKVQKGKGKKGKGGMLIVLILIVAAVLIIALFMVFGRKEKGKEPGEELGKEAKGEGDFDGRPFDNL